MIQFNFLLENGAFSLDENTGKFSVNRKIAKQTVKSLAHILLTIQAEGNYKAAKNLIKDYGVMTETMKTALDKLGDIPVDIKPVYEIES